MEAFPSRERFETAVAEARALLARHGYAYRGDSDALMAWLQTDTPYPNPSPAELLETPLLVVHELVEIAEVQGMGLRITRDVIVKNLEKINDAHLRAAEVEIAIAMDEGRTDYVRSRVPDVAGWCEDPLLTPSQKREYEAFRARIDGWLRPRVTGTHGAATEKL